MLSCMEPEAMKTREKQIKKKHNVLAFNKICGFGKVILK